MHPTLRQNPLATRATVPDTCMYSHALREKWMVNSGAARSTFAGVVGSKYWVTIILLQASAACSTTMRSGAGTKELGAYIVAFQTFVALLEASKVHQVDKAQARAEEAGDSQEPLLLLPTASLSLRNSDWMISRPHSAALRKSRSGVVPTSFSTYCQ